jgi:formate hydrogenlyase subunit 6/NADH:ubiquinone oxidoreductase subunit I
MMSKLGSIFDLLEKLESRCVSVHKDRCVLLRNRNASCLRCAQACTSGCITYAEGKLLVSPEKCIGCGTCASVCPTGALEAQDPNDAELFKELLLANQAADNSCAIACVDVLKAAKDSYDSAKVVGVACLGRIEESVLAALAQAGAREIVLVQGQCLSCEYAKGLEAARAVCATTATLLDAWNRNTNLRITEELPGWTLREEKPVYDESRRAFFSAMKDGLKNLAGQAARQATEERLGKTEATLAPHIKVMADGTLPHFLPLRRKRLLKCLSYWDQPDDVLIETRLFGQILIDKKLCSGCQMCATFCPTAAISKYADQDGNQGLEFSPQNCVKCRCCQDICPENAITISEQIFAIDIITGAVDRYQMPAGESPLEKSRSIVDAIKSFSKSEQIYER